MARQETVRVWRLGPELLAAAADEGMAARYSDWRTMLSIAEQRRADAFRAEQHRRDYMVAHVGLRVVLGRLVQAPPALLRFSAENGQKPALMEDSGTGPEQLDLRFNLSHTQGAVLIAVAEGFEVGVDVEQQRPLEDLEGMARTVMSDMESAHWLKLSPELRCQAFYRLWTRKEAYLKAIGLGLFRDLHEVTVPVSPAPLAEPAVVTDQNGDGVWSVLDVPVGEGFSASLCWQGASAVEVMVKDLSLDDLLLKDLR